MKRKCSDWRIIPGGISYGSTYLFAGCFASLAQLWGLPGRLADPWAAFHAADVDFAEIRARHFGFESNFKNLAGRV